MVEKKNMKVGGHYKGEAGATLTLVKGSLRMPSIWMAPDLKSSKKL